MVVVLTVAIAHAESTYLHWQAAPIPVNYTCIYGEIDVLATAPGTYFCGCNWWPGAEAGGYTGIQQLSEGPHVMIFSIWDSAPGLLSQPVDWARGTTAGRFGGEGVGARTIRNYNWRVGRTYRYFCIKKQAGSVTLTSAYYFDDEVNKWVYTATIASPNMEGHGGIGGFGGGLNAFVENFSGGNKDNPRLALYRLWMGTSVSELSEVTSASGAGAWGVLRDSFYIGFGDPTSVDMLINRESGDSQATRGGSEWLHVSQRKLPPELLKQLEQLARG